MSRHLRHSASVQHQCEMTDIASITRSTSSSVLNTPGLKRTAPHSMVPRRRWAIGTVESDTNRDAEVSVEDRPDILRRHRLDIGGEDGDVVSQVLCRVHLHAAKPGEPVAQPFEQGHLLRVDRLHAVLQDVVEADREPKDSDEVGGAGLEPVRVTWVCSSERESMPVPPNRVVRRRGRGGGQGRQSPADRTGTCDP